MPEKFKELIRLFEDLRKDTGKNSDRKHEVKCSKLYIINV